MNRPTYINTDLELSSKEDLSSIAAELSSSVFILLNEKVNGEFQLNFECTLDCDEESNSLLLKTISEFLDIIDSLSSESKAKFSACHRKVLDIGYDSAPEGFLYTNIPNTVLERIVDFGFDLNISIYGNEVDQHS